MASVGAWNVKGLNRTCKHSEVKNLLSYYNCVIFGFLETTVRHVNFHKVFPRVCFGWLIVTNYQFHDGGRIWVVLVS